jgi:hypothetical protein
MIILEWAIYLDVILNLILSLIVIFWDLYFYFKVDEKEKWTKILYICVGIFWFVRYALFLFDVDKFSRTDNFNPVLVLGLTLTLLALSIGSIVRMQKIGGKDLIKRDIKTLIDRIKLWTSKTS